MRVVLLTQVAPNPPDAGPRIKTHFLLRTLASEHSVDLITFVRSDEEAEAARALHPWCRSVTTIPLQRRRYLEPYYVVNGWARRVPFLVARDARRAFADAVRARIASGDVDVLHADQLSMAQYLTLADGTRVKTVFDAHNAVWELVRTMVSRQPTPLHRLMAEVEWRLLRRFEGSATSRSDLTLVVADQDRQSLSAAAGTVAHTCLVPIGVEVQEQRPVPHNPQAIRILSVATMHYPPNAEAIRWFRDAIWPKVHQACPDLEVDIVGSRPPEDISRWRDDDPGVQVHGYVPCIDSLYADAAVFIVPLKAGSGVRVKILEAMARGVCVVSTSIGAEGLDLIHREHLMVADTEEEFSRAILELAACPSLRRSLSTAARQRVLERYDWRVCCLPVLEAYKALR
jgi:polysaccharide biosynthesis protein PslH